MAQGSIGKIIDGEYVPFATNGGGSVASHDATKVDKTDISSIILAGSINNTGETITAGTWFYLNGKPCIAKVDIASGATFTDGTNYEEKTIGSALSELNGKIGGYSSKDITSYIASSGVSFGNFRAIAYKSGRVVTIEVYFTSLSSTLQRYGDYLFSNLSSLNLGIAHIPGDTTTIGILVNVNLDWSAEPDNTIYLQTNAQNTIFIRWPRSMSTTNGEWIGSITYISNNDDPIV